jgi:creatinine amidohydrolase
MVSILGSLPIAEPFEPSSETRYAALTRAEATQRAKTGATCLVPVGALEQHGDHLPLSTDWLLAEHVCLSAAAQAERDAVVTPPLWTGLSPHHLRFGATVTLSSSTFSGLVREVVGSLASQFPRVVVINGHGGNRGPLITLGLEHGIESYNYWELVRADRLRELFPVDLGSVGHAGEFETSAMLAAFPNLVGEPSTDGTPIDEDNSALLVVGEISDHGVVGKPGAATADAGRVALDEIIASLVSIVDAGSESGV